MRRPKVAFKVVGVAFCMHWKTLSFANPKDYDASFNHLKLKEVYTCKNQDSIFWCKSNPKAFIYLYILIPSFSPC